MMESSSPGYEVFSVQQIAVNFTGRVWLGDPSVKLFTCGGVLGNVWLYLLPLATWYLGMPGLLPEN